MELRLGSLDFGMMDLGGSTGWREGNGENKEVRLDCGWASLVWLDWYPRIVHLVNSEGVPSLNFVCLNQMPSEGACLISIRFFHITQRIIFYDVYLSLELGRF